MCVLNEWRVSFFIYMDFLSQTLALQTFRIYEQLYMHVCLITLFATTRPLLSEIYCLLNYDLID